PFFLIPTGLLVSLLSGLLPVLLGRSFMTGVWFAESVVVIGAFGSDLLFDLGVYMVVVGVVLTILFTISENTYNGIIISYFSRSFLFCRYLYDVSQKYGKIIIRLVTFGKRSKHINISYWRNH